MDKWILDIEPDESTTSLAARTLESRLGAILCYLPKAAQDSDGDTEHVHQLRVWTRRAKSAIRLYADFLSRHRAKQMLQQLKLLRHAANDARDLDVLIQRLTTEYLGHQIDPCLELLREQRQEAQMPLVAVYDRLSSRNRLERQISKLVNGVRPRKSLEEDELLFHDWAQGQWQRLANDFFEANPSPSAGTLSLHKFRIRGKELRYAMEILAGAFPASYRDELYPHLEEFQDKIGAVIDRWIALDTLRRLLQKKPDKQRQYLLRKVLAKERSALRDSRQAFWGWWTPERQEKLRTSFQEYTAGSMAASSLSD